MNALTNYLSGLGAWNWLILSVVLFVLETVVPGVHFVWFGMAATVIGILALSVDVSWQWQLVLFGLISMTTVLIVRRYAAPGASPSDQPDLNIRGKYYIGRIVTVENAIVNGRGRVKIGDSVWAASGPDMEAGQQAKVVGVDGTVLVVDTI